MPWFLYAWFSTVAFEVALAYKIKNNKQWCDAQNFLAKINSTKIQYRVFDYRNIEMIYDGGVVLSEAEEICKNMTMCYHCILPEPKNDEENKVLIQLAEHCEAKPFLGLESNSVPPMLRWRSDKTPVTLFKEIKCTWYYHDLPCYQIINSRWCKVKCETAKSLRFICEMRPPVPGLQVSTVPSILKPPSRDPPSPVPDTDQPSSGSDATDLSVLTIVAIAVGSLGWLLLLCGVIAVCVYCFYSSRKRAIQNRENTAQNADQNQPVMGSAPGNMSQTTVTQPTYTQGQPGPVYTQASPSQSTPAPANTDVQQASGSSVSPEPHSQKRVTRTVS